MKQTAKGQYGYLPAQYKWEVLKTVTMFAVSIAILVTGMVITMHRKEGITWTESKNNILTVAAVLGMLPASRSLISAIMFARGKRYTCPQEVYRRLEEVKNDDRNLPLLCYDLYLTEYDKVFPVYVMAATEGELLGLLAESGDVAKAQEHIRDALQKDGQKNVTVKLYQDEEKFLDRIKAAAKDNGSAKEDKEAPEKARKHMEVMLQISL